MRPARQLLADRAPWKAAQGRRIRKLYHGFIANLTADDPLHQAAALRAAELAVATEDARARLLALPGDQPAEEAVVRLEKTARRAAADLVPLIPKPVKWWEQQHEEADDGEEEN